MGKITIKPNDTLWDIANEYNTTVDYLAKTNGISNPNLIQAGATLVVPDIDKLGIGDGGNSSNEKKKDEGFKYTPFEYGDYKESDTVKESKTKKEEAENALTNYGDFSYKNQAGLDEIMQKILNREDFSYDFNTDALYQQYKDKYIKQGKMAMQDTIGQASAMTGGYGNSYAVTAGSQAYQQHLENLNDVIPELYQMAYDRYNQEGQEMLSQYGLLSDDYSREYGQWEAGYNRLANDRSYYGTQYDNERSWDYGKWSDNRNFEQGQHNTEQGYLYQDYRDKITDEQWQAEQDLKERAQKILDEEWGYKKKAYEDEQNNTTPTHDWNPKTTVAQKDTTKNNLSVKTEDEPEIKATSTGNTTNFANSVSDKSRYLQSGHSLAEWNEYIEGKINQWDKLIGFTDEELAYLVKYYGLS